MRFVRFAAAAVVVALGGLLAWHLTHQDNKTASAILRDKVVPAPPFRLPGLAGGTVSLAAYRGRVVVLNFWASDCIPCKKEMPHLQQAAERWAPKGVAVVGIDPGFDSRTAARAFLRRHRIGYRSGFDHYADVTTRYGVQGTPTTFFIDRRGQIVGHVLGPVPLDELDAQISRALAS